MFRAFAFSMNQIPAAAARLRRSIRLSPPLGLLVLTLIVLLLALGTAKADGLVPADDGPKWRYGRAMVALTHADQAEFAALMTPELGLTVEQIMNGASEGRRVFSAALTEEEFERSVVPVLQALAEAGEPSMSSVPLLCDDQGACVRDTGWGTVTIQFADKANGVRIVSMRLDSWDEPGC